MEQATSFSALVLRRAEGEKKPSAAVETLALADLPDEPVLVKVEYSSLNYKDGLAISGAAPIARAFPMVAGIDLAGEVVESQAGAFKPGDKVLVNGFGLSEKHWGGYAQFQRVNDSFLLPLPKGLSTKDAMAFGTAGYTAALCVLALEAHGLKKGDAVLVTGASGGVGCVAVQLLASRGFAVVASTGSDAAHAMLKESGAAEIIARAELAEKSAPLGKERWAGAVDSVGGVTLANVLAQTAYGGAVAACGLAGGADLPASVMPFILRGVALLGVDSVQAPMAKRVAAWDLLASAHTAGAFAAMEQWTAVHPMGELMQLAPQILAGKINGRVVIEVAGA